MTTLREAAQQALEALTDFFNAYPHMAKGYTEDAINNLRAALTEPVQEPVAWMLGDEVYRVKQCRLFSKHPGEEIPGQIPLYTAPPTKTTGGQR